MKKHCPKHPKYKGKKDPKRDCPDCLSLYITFGLKPRGKSIPPSRVLPDKKKYNRKKKTCLLDD